MIPLDILDRTFYTHPESGLMFSASYVGVQIIIALVIAYRNFWAPNRKK